MKLRANQSLGDWNVMSRSNRDHGKKTHRPMIEDEAIAEKLETLLRPALAAQRGYYRHLKLRERILTLPLMVAAVLTLLWRNVPGVAELLRLLKREGFLWCAPQRVSQQALSKRFLEFPAELFERVFKHLLPPLNQAWYGRQNRPLPESIRFARFTFERIWIVDGSTLEALFRKLKSLEVAPPGQLAGKMATVIDLVTRLPVEIWFKDNPRASDIKFEEELLNLVEQNTLLLLDRGFYHFYFWKQLLAQGVHLITRLKQGASYQVEQVFSQSHDLRDRRVRMGNGTEKRPFITLRLIEIRVGNSWKSYLTSVLDPHILPPYVVADLYGRRWRIEEAFNTVKRLLGLSYLWTGSLNGVQLQIWATWLFYAILVDMGDAIADELSLPFQRISLEMTYRGLYHFSVARQKGFAQDPIQYFAAPENQDLGIVKRQRKTHKKLIIAPFPDQMRRSPLFFFHDSLTACPTS